MFRVQAGSGVGGHGHIQPPPSSHRYHTEGLPPDSNLASFAFIFTRFSHA